MAVLDGCLQQNIANESTLHLLCWHRYIVTNTRSVAESIHFGQSYTRPRLKSKQTLNKQTNKKQSKQKQAFLLKSKQAKNKLWYNEDESPFSSQSQDNLPSVAALGKTLDITTENLLKNKNKARTRINTVWDVNAKIQKNSI